VEKKFALASLLQRGLWTFVSVSHDKSQRNQTFPQRQTQIEFYNSTPALNRLYMRHHSRLCKFSFIKPNAHCGRRRNSTQQLSCVGVGSVYWVLGVLCTCL